MLRNQKGFTTVEGLLILVIVAIIGGTGYYVYHSQKQTDKTLDSAANTSQSAVNQKTTAAKTTQAASTGYLVIKEWGVKFKEDSSSTDAYYKFYPADEDPNQQYLYLDSKDLDAHSAPDGTSCAGEYIAILSRYNNGDSGINDPMNAAIAEKTVGNYTYTMATLKQSAAACLYDDNQNKIEPNFTVYSQKITAYTKLFNTIQAE